MHPLAYSSIQTGRDTYLHAALAHCTLEGGGVTWTVCDVTNLTVVGLPRGHRVWLENNHRAVLRDYEIDLPDDRDGEIIKEHERRMVK